MIIPGPFWIIQDNLISKYLMTSAKSPLPCNIVTGSGLKMWICLGNHYSAQALLEVEE